MDKYSNSKWTSVNKIFGWRHFEVRNIFKKLKKIELFSVCDKSISIIINIDEIENKEKWLPGWKEIV